MTLPEYFDRQGRPNVSIPGHGRARLEGISMAGEVQGRVDVVLEVREIRVYDVWLEVGEAWVQLHRHGAAWRSDALAGTVSRVRFWVAPAHGVAMPEADLEPDVGEVQPYLPVIEGEPPLPSERALAPLSSRLARWVHTVQDDLVVAAMLEEWTEACAEAVVLGWMSGMPRGDDLLLAYARSPGADTRYDGHEVAFCRWVITEWGRQVRDGIHRRRDLESRRAGVERMVPALIRLFRAVAPALSVVSQAPAVIGPAQRHHWLVDESLSKNVDNPVVTLGAHRPVFVLRPLLEGPSGVVVEGEVV